MATRTWGAGSVMDGNWGTATCWTGDTKPQAGDAVVFDNTDDTNCLMDEAPAALLSMDVQAGYDGNIDFNDQSFSCGDMTFDGTGTVSCGAGTITCSGNFDNKDQATWTRETSTLVMTGAGKTIISYWNKSLYSLTIDGSITLDAATGSYLSVSSGTLQINNGKSFVLSDVLRNYSDTTNLGTLTVNTNSLFRNGIANSGTVDGSGQITCDGVASVITNAGTWSVANTVGTSNTTVGAGSYGGTWTFRPETTSKTFAVGTGGGQTVTFTGDVTIDCDTAGTYTVDAATNDASVVFQGDLSLTETVGTTVWSKAATGTVTFSKGSGTQVYTDSTAAVQDLGLVFHDGAGTLQLAAGDEMECTTFDGDAGTFDPNGGTVDCSGNCDWDAGWNFIGDADALNGCIWLVGGNFTAEAQTCKATAAWYLQVTGTAVVSGVGAVAYSDASGYTEIDASAGPWTDNENNTNWDFGGVSLVVQDSECLVESDSPALTQHQILAVADSECLVESEGVVLTQHHVLSVADSACVVESEQPALTQHQVLAVGNSACVVESETVALTQHHALAVDDSACVVESETVALVQNHVLTVQGSASLVQSESPAFTQHQSLVVDGSACVVASDNVVFGTGGKSPYYYLMLAS